MSDLVTFAQLGFRHIVDWAAMDHILFLVALAAIYRFRDARKVLWVVTAFTIGHSVTLALAVTGVLTLPPALIEFLIPVTIVATGIENLLVRDREQGRWGWQYRPVFAGVFGLVHGAGFANYLKAMFVDQIAVPLLGFNIGIELGQILVLVAIAVVLLCVDRLLAAIRQPSASWQVLRIRIVSVSVVIIVVGTSLGGGAAPVVTGVRSWLQNLQMVSKARRVLIACVAAMCLLASRPSAIVAHPLHTTLTEMTVDGQRGVLHLMIRVFADDFARAASGPASGAPGVRSDALVDAYLRRSFALTDAGRTVALRPCAGKRTGDLLWLCFEAPAPTSLTALRLHDALLCDLFDDQINIVRVTVAGTSHSLLFTRGNPPKSLL